MEALKEAFEDAKVAKAERAKAAAEAKAAERNPTLGEDNFGAART